jgi:CheY-like chemotaxis protein
MGRILLVDDDEALLKVMARALESGGHEVVSAPNARTAIAMLVNLRPDVLITDIFMPETGGLETIRAIRASTRPIKIIAISGGGMNSRLSFLETAKTLGADAALAKPFSLEELRATVSEVLARPYDEPE